MFGRVDLHFHSYYSDGELSPLLLLRQAKKLGFTVLSLTDHNAFLDYPEFKKQAKKRRIITFPGLELSAQIYGRHIHIMGYGFDYKNPLLAQFLQKIQKQREREINQIVTKLKEAGFSWREEWLKKQKAEYYGLKHLVVALSKSKKNLARFKKEAGSLDLFAIINFYFVEGKIAYVPEKYLPAQLVIKTIKKLGGFTSLGHPGVHLEFEQDDLIAQLKKIGLQAIEAITPQHTWSQILHYQWLAKKLRLQITGGSNFHGIDWQAEIVGDPRQYSYLPYKLWLPLKKLIEHY